MTVALNSNALLTDVTELNAMSGLALTAGDTVNTLINIASDFIERYTKRFLKTATYTLEVYDGDGSFYLYPKQWPITAISALHRWDTSGNVSLQAYTANTDYLYDGTRGRIYLREGFECGVQNYKITYTAGYVTLPYDIRKACALFCEWEYNRRGKTGYDSESIGDYSYRLSQGKTVDGNAMPPEVLSLLSKYVRRDII